MSEPQTLKVLAYNVQIFPKQIYPAYRLLFDCDGNTKVVNRIEKIAENLRSSNADIVMLSEMWDIESVIRLHRLLKDLYPYSISSECVASNICFTNTMLIKYPCVDAINSSGLMLLSKYPIDRVDFTAFHDKQHAELLVKKGFLISTIVLNGDMQVGVIGTHVQAYNYAKTRQSNLRQIMHGIAQYRQKNPNNPVIVLGDFNVPYGSSEYAMLQSAMTHEGLFNVQDVAPNGPAMCQLGRDFAHTACYKKSVCDLDYIYTSANAVRYYTVPDALSPEDLKMSFGGTYRDDVKGVNGVMLSDHLPIMAILSMPSETTPIIDIGNGTGVDIIDAYEFADRDLTIQNIISFIMILLVAVLSFYYIYSIQVMPVQAYDM